MTRNQFTALIVLATIGVALADNPRPTSPKNLDFEAGEVGKTPPNWFMPKVCADDGYKLAVSEEKPFAGKRCAVLSRHGKDAPHAFGNIIQSVSAKDYRGKRIRYKAAVRAEVGKDAHAAMWLRVDRGDSQMGFFDNMGDRPITNKDWKHHEIIGDVAEDAEAIVFGLMLIGNGQAGFDDVTFEVVDPSAARATGVQRVEPSPGLVEIAMEADMTIFGKTNPVMVYPLPLSYRDQVPLTFHLTVDPPEAAKSVEIIEVAGENRVLKLELENVKRKIHIGYRSVVLVGPTKFAAVPKTAKFPKDWPAEAKPWLASTWAVDHENERVKKIAAEIRGDSDDVIATIAATLVKAKDIFAQTKGHVDDLTSVEALDKHGSCTSCANLVAALLRGAGVPARVLSGYPLWSGPLQTHYIVEAWVPDFGWYPVESTMCQSPWPNHQQINVSIVPIEHEHKDKAGRRTCAAGAVPYLSLTECAEPKASFLSVGTLKPFCDHQAKLVRAITATDAEWSVALNWAKPRWASWLKSKPELANGKVVFGLEPTAIQGKTLVEVQAEMK